MENPHTLGVLLKYLLAHNLLTTISLKPARVGVRADDVGAKRPEEACIPRDGGIEGELNATHRRWRFKRGSYIAQIRGGTVGMRHMSVRQASHTNLSK